MLKGRIQIKDQKPVREGLGIAGKIKIGEKKITNGKEYPVSLDYFRLDAKDPDYIKSFEDAYGPKPSTIQIMFLSDDPAHSCNEELQVRDQAGKIYCKSDGQTVLIASELGLTEVAQEKVESYGGVLPLMEAAAKHCKSRQGVQRSLTIRFIIPKMNTFLAEFTLTTRGGMSSIEELIKVFDNTKNYAGTVMRIVFDLRVEKVKSNTSGQSRVYPVLKLIPNLSQKNLEIVRQMVERGENFRRIGTITNESLSQISSPKKNDNE